MEKENKLMTESETPEEKPEQSEEVSRQNEEQKPQEEKLFTQSDIDRIISDRLRREEEKRAKEIERAKEEGKRLASLTEDERKQEEQRLKEQELEETKEKLRRLELTNDTVDRLNEEGIPLEFKEFLMGDDAESTNQNIKNFKMIYQKEIENAVVERLRGKTPTIGGTPYIERNKKPQIGDYAEQKRLIK